MRQSLFLAGLLVSLAGTAWAHLGDKVFPIVELTDEEVARIDVKDGSVEDWLEVVGEPTLTALDFDTGPTRAPYDPADLDFRIWLAWHRASHHLYVAMERSDDIYLNELNRNDNSCLNLDCSMINQDSSGGRRNPPRKFGSGERFLGADQGVVRGVGHLLIGIFPTQAAVMEHNLLAVDVVAKAPAAQGQPVLTATSGNVFEFLDVLVWERL